MQAMFGSYFIPYPLTFLSGKFGGTLLYGGRLVIAPYWTTRSPDQIQELLSKEKITVLNQTPSSFKQMVLATDNLQRKLEQFPVLRTIILGGEALDLMNFQSWFELDEDKRPQLVNMYGTTETTVHITYCPLTQNILDRSWSSPIGSTIPDLQLYLLDRFFNPVLPGAVGEICVGGQGLSRGYLNLPSLSAERFIPNPFSSMPGDRLYRTGDLGRIASNGEIEYVGRLDFQVKVRGFRLELKEIQEFILKYKEIQDAIVLTQKDGTNTNILVAYIVPKTKATLLLSDLRFFLSQKLPEFMIPSTFIILDKLPLTLSGKIDTKDLLTYQKKYRKTVFCFFNTQDCYGSIFRQNLE